jgi:hypothetical protein
MSDTQKLEQVIHHPTFNGFSVEERDWVPKGKMIIAGRAIYVPCIYTFVFMEGVTTDSLNRAIEFAKKKVLKAIDKSTINIGTAR